MLLKGIGGHSEPKRLTGDPLSATNLRAGRAADQWVAATDDNPLPGEYRF